MNPENPIDPRQALEPSLTALLLGELPEDQARLVRQAMASDAELAKTFERLKQTTALIREAEAPAVQAPTAILDAPRLSDCRRQDLLRRFKTIHPPAFEERRRGQSLSWVVPVAAAGVLMLAVAGLLLPALSRPKNLALAQRSLQELKAPISSEATIRSPLEGRSSGAAGSESNLARKLSRDLLVENENLSRPPTTPWSVSASATSPTVPEARPQGSIVLPAESTQSTMPASTPEPQANRAWNFSGTSEFGYFNTFNPVAGSAQQETPLDFAQNSSSSLAGSVDRETSAAAAPVPVLGDVPLIGHAFRPDSSSSNSILAFSSTNGVTAFLGYDDPGAFVPQAQTAAVESTGVANPLTRNLPLPHYRFLYSYPWTTNSGNGLGLDASNPAKGQLVRPYYAGGAFGGFSTIQPHVPQPGQQVDFVTIQGIGQVPVFKDQVPADLPALSKSPAPALPSAKTEEPAQVDNGRKLAPAEGDAKRDGTEQLRQKLEVAGRREYSIEAKKGADERAKSTAYSPGDKEPKEQEDAPAVRAPATPAEPRPEVQVLDNPFSTFSLNVSDVSFKLAAAGLEQGKLPDPASIRSEEFINAFDYRDPEPAANQRVGFAWERAGYPFAQNRDLLRFSLKTAAGGREAGKPLNVVLLLDNSGSMERADRVQIIHEALRVLASQLRSGDTLSVVTFARTARLWVDGVPGDQAGRVADELSGLTPQGGTNLEEAMSLAYQTALRHYLAGGLNRVVLLTDGAANLGNTDPSVLKQKVEANRKQGIALDCFGIGWEGYNDDLLEELTRNGDGRYGFLNTPEAAATQFAGQLAGALQPAAADVKVQVEFNPKRVTSYRQIGYARRQLTQEQFRDNAVNAAAIGAAESGNALYVIQTNPQGEGAIATVRVRYRLPGTADYQEQEWTVPYSSGAVAFEQAGAAMRLAGTAAAFSEWLARSPYATEVTPDRLLSYLNGVSSTYGADPRPQKLEWMIRQAKTISGK